MSQDTKCPYKRYASDWWELPKVAWTSSKSWPTTQHPESPGRIPGMRVSFGAIVSELEFEREGLTRRFIRNELEGVDKVSARRHQQPGFFVSQHPALGTS